MHSLRCQFKITAFFFDTHKQRQRLFDQGLRLLLCIRKHTMIQVKAPHLKQQGHAGKILFRKIPTAVYNFLERLYGKVTRKRAVHPADLFVCHLRLIAHQRIDADIKKRGQLRKQRNVRISGRCLPFGYRRFGYTHVCRKFFLRDTAFSTVFHQDAAELDFFWSIFHRSHLSVCSHGFICIYYRMEDKKIQVLLRNYSTLQKFLNKQLFFL